jgi:hypothetical protein
MFLKKFGAAALLSAFALLPMVSSAAISPGTVLSGTMDQNISSGSAQVGPTFTISNAHSANYNINGATSYGHVSSVQKAGQGRPGKIQLTVDRIHTRAGNTYVTAGYVTSAQVITKSNATKEAVAGLAGAVVGSILTHGKTLGVLAGAAGAYLLAKNNRENVTINPGTKITVQLSQTRRQASHY